LTHLRTFPRIRVPQVRGIAQPGSERTVRDREVGGSNPLAPTIFFPVRVPVLLLLLLIAAPAFPWGDAGHAITNESATLALPTDMPHFFYQAFPQLIWMASDPDRWRNAGASLDDVNPPDHFIDYEYVATMQLPPQRYQFIDQLYASGTLRRNGISNTTIGFLPWRTAEICDRLTNEWRQWRFSRPDTTERRAIEADIIHDAGLLSHFAGDAAQPLHASSNYNGWVMPNPKGYANDCAIHARFERDFVSRAISTSDVVPFITRPQLRTDYFATDIAFIRASNALVERLYAIDRDGGFDTLRPINADAKQFTAERLAAGASLLRDLWWSTWINSAKPSKRTAVE
jgi:hypothetical protein